MGQVTNVEQRIAAERVKWVEAHKALRSMVDNYYAHKQEQCAGGYYFIGNHYDAINAYLVKAGY